MADRVSHLLPRAAAVPGRLFPVALLVLCLVLCITLPTRAGLLDNKAGTLLKKAQPAKDGGGDYESDADSLASLWTQDVGVDRHKGAFSKLVWRTRLIDMNLKAAGQSIDNARTEIFNVAATSEQRKQLEELDTKVGQSEGAAKDELIAERKRYESEAIEGAKKDGSLEQKRLSGEQAGRMALVGYNLGIAAWCNSVVSRSLPKLGDDMQNAIANPLDPGVIKYGKDVGKFPGYLTGWPGQLTSQLGAIQSLLGTIQVLKRNNSIEERPVDPAAGWAKEEDF